ncbi:SOS response-associated peptidase [Alteribacillus iranensis]|uniref:Abasic site processing protein n=1 Tax=Alteribacillus iranensis TaxID=930128 RepID=A0A1I2EVG5_9BACI|nr:SOS response-associated peptidase [Alteribacillus iranensis]SFE96789.1 Putative SOS response-associated peptidase YedK [Alteribacillus iranensis]
MCGRFTLTSSLQDIDKAFPGNVIRVDNYQPSYNIAPSQQILSVIYDGKAYRWGTLQWGLIPRWATDKKMGQKLINARAETVDEKNSFKHAFRKRRCLIPADGFYEWRRTDDGKKQPYRIHLTDRSLFTFAGLWEKWTDDEGHSIFSCTILTTRANQAMERIHHRMPVIVPKDYEEDWLDPTKEKKDDLRTILEPIDSSHITMYPVSTEVNSPRNNYADLLNSL